MRDFTVRLFGNPILGIDYRRAAAARLDAFGGLSGRPGGLFTACSSSSKRVLLVIGPLMLLLLGKLTPAGFFSADRRRPPRLLFK